MRALGEGASGIGTSEPRRDGPNRREAQTRRVVNAGPSEHTYPPDRRRTASAPSEPENGRDGEGAPNIKKLLGGYTMAKSITKNGKTYSVKWAVNVVDGEFIREDNPEITESDIEAEEAAEIEDAIFQEALNKAEKDL